MSWTPERIAKLEELWAEGLSTAEIGRRLGVSKNAVVGKAHRMKLPGRQSPIESKRKAKPAAAKAPAAAAQSQNPQRNRPQQPSLRRRKPPPKPRLNHRLQPLKPKRTIKKRSRSAAAPSASGQSAIPACRASTSARTKRPQASRIASITAALPITARPPAPLKRKLHNSRFSWSLLPRLHFCQRSDFRCL